MTRKDHSTLYETYHYKCSKCGTTYPSAKVEKCFACGGANTVVYSPVSKKKKPKSTARGATIKINL